MPENDQFKGKEFSVYVKATDKNGLNLPDANLDITISVNSISTYEGSKLICPKILWKHSPKIDNVGETKITIPDSIFPKANLSYTIDFKLTTSDNQLIKDTKNITYYNQNEVVEARIINDSIEFYYLKNGVETADWFSLYQNYSHPDIPQSTLEVVLPFKVKINQNIASNHLKKDDIFYYPEIPQPTLNSFISRNNDSVQISVLIRKTLNLHTLSTEKTKK